jgi:hypothetical protein
MASAETALGATGLEKGHRRDPSYIHGQKQQKKDG